MTYKNIIESGVRGDKTEIGSIASKGNNYSTVMFWNYHDDDKISSDESIQMTISGIPSKKVLITQYRIDRDLSNSYEVWKKIGSPQNPSAEQYTELEKAGMLKMYGISVNGKVKKGLLQINTKIQRQGVGLVKIEWK